MDTAIGYGTEFQIGDGASPEVFTKLAEVLSISGPAFAKDAVEVTNMDSPSNFREYTPGMKDPGSISMSVNLTSANLTTLNTELGKTTATNYKVVFPTAIGKTWSFSAFLINFSHDAPVDDRMSLEVEYKIVGATTLT